jgi:parvulin-like peptidyl-prolyl isomerase
VYELKQKLAERDESLDEIRESFRKEFLFRGFLEHKIGPKLKVELPEMREYYAAHLNDFDRPAQLSWREVIVEVQKQPSRVAARAKADAVLARLRRGEGFAAVAKAESDGPNKSGGGLWQTTPGSYGVPAVNAALESLPVGRVSTVLEGPTSYHVVLVEARRPAGPASFFEVQDKVYKAIRAQKIAKESNAFLDRLRRQTIVTTEFDDPGVTRTSAELRNAGPRRAASAPVR